MDPPSPLVPVDGDPETVGEEEALRREQDAVTRDELSALERRERAASEESACLNYAEIEAINAMSPPNRIPPELLGRIFEHHGTICWQAYMGTYSWTVVMHVCRQWRHVALSTPSLWTLIVPTSVESVEYALAHSGELPLMLELLDDDKVCLAVESGAYDRVFSSARQRIEDIEIFVPRNAAEFFATRFATLDAPLLERLDISYESVMQLPIPQSSAALPKLYNFNISAGPQQILAPLFSSTLQFLTLSLMELSDPYDLVELLRQLPSLHELTLIRTFSNQWILPAGATPSRDPVHLPCLQTLILDDNTSTHPMAHLIRQIMFPATARVKLKLVAGNDVWHDVPRILSSLVPKLLAPGPRGSSVLQPQSISITLSRSDRCEFSFWPNVRFWGSVDPGSQDAPQLVLNLPGRPLGFTVRTLFCLLNSHAIVTLRIRVALNREMWVDAFRNMDQLESLRIRIEKSKCAYMFLEVFLAPLPQDTHPDAEDGDGSPRYLFPGLKVLELEIRAGVRGSPRLSLPDIIHRAADMLTRRTQCGLGLSTLRIIACGMRLSGEELKPFDDPAIVTHIEVRAGDHLLKSWH